MIGIYKIENKLNGKIYIGKSSNIELRFTQHREALAHSQSSWYPEARAESTNINNFDFSILQICNLEELDELEEYWTQYYNSNIQGYNKRFASGGLILSSDSIIDFNNINIINKIFHGINTLLDGKCGVARTLIYYFILLLKQEITIVPFETTILHICNIDHAQYSRARTLLHERNIISYTPNQSIKINFQTIINQQ